MSKPATWGDQTTVQACADCYKLRIHLVTTHTDNHHIVVEPGARQKSANNKSGRPWVASLV